MRSTACFPVLAGCAILLIVPASAAVNFTITPTGPSSATVTGIGALEDPFSSAVGIAFVNPDPLVGADDGSGDTLSGTLTLGGNAFTVVSTQGGGQLQFRFPTETDLFVSDVASGTASVTFDIETIGPIGTTGDVRLFDNGEGNLVVGSYSIVPEPRVLGSIGLAACVGGLRRRRR